MKENLQMAIERNTYTDILFDALMAAGCTVYGACAAMGNIYAESRANPRNLEISVRRN